MFKEKPQSNNQETRSLDMARQALGRVKEMALTPKEKKKVLLMIDNAQKEEAINKARALNIYIELKKYLEGLNTPERGVLMQMDSDEIKNKQIVKIKQEIAALKGNKDHTLQEIKELKQRMLKQIKDIKIPNEKKIMFEHNGSSGFVNFELDHEARQFNVAEIKDALIKVQKVADDKDDIYIKQCRIDDSGALAFLWLGKVGAYDRDMVYLPAGSGYFYSSLSQNQLSSSGLGRAYIFQDEISLSVPGRRQMYWNDKAKAWYDTNDRPM